MRSLVWALSTCPLIFLVACGGGTNNTKQPEQQLNAAPAIQALVPSTAPAGSGDLTVQINGSGFMTTSSVQWAGAAKNCSFVSNAVLSCSVTAADLSIAANAAVSVTNPAPGGGTAQATFVIGAPNVPTLSSISPSSVVPGSSSFTLTANGSGYVCEESDKLTIRVVNTCVQGVQGCSTAPLADVPVGVVPVGVTSVDWDRMIIPPVRMSTSGRYVASTGHSEEITISDTCIGAPTGCQPRTAFASLNSEGAFANAPCQLAGMSEDGKYIFYVTSATNLGTSPETNNYYGYVVSNPLL